MSPVADLINIAHIIGNKSTPVSTKESNRQEILFQSNSLSISLKA